MAEGRALRAVPRVEAVIFDLAGVLLDFAGPESVARISGGMVGHQEFGRFWSESPWADALYRGRCSAEEFAGGAVRELGLSVAPGEFLRDFQSWFRGAYAGAFDLVARVRRHAAVACLSNTNCFDVARFRSELRLHERFDQCFFSNEIGLRKPDADCYALVLERLRCADPARVLFFDDSEACVRGARAIGMQALEAHGPMEVWAHLETHGWPVAVTSSSKRRCPSKAILSRCG